MKRFLLVALCAILFGGATSFIVVRSVLNGNQSDVYTYSDEVPQVRNVKFSGEYPDFTYAAETSVQAVVFVKVIKRSEGNQMPPSIFDYFFGFVIVNTSAKETVAKFGMYFF